MDEGAPPSRSPGFLHMLEKRESFVVQMRALGAVLSCEGCGEELIIGNRAQCALSELVWVAPRRVSHRRCHVPQSWMAL